MIIINMLTDVERELCATRVQLFITRLWCFSVLIHATFCDDPSSLPQPSPALPCGSYCVDAGDYWQGGLERCALIHFHSFLIVLEHSLLPSSNGQTIADS